MVDDVLRMRATLVSEQALAQIRALGREIGIVPTRAAPGIKTLNTEFVRLGQTIKNVGRELQQTIPLFGGIGSIGAGLSLGVLSRQLNETAKRVVELKYASKELGMSERELRGWGVAAEKVGVSTESMIAGMKDFASTAAEVKIGIGETRNQLYALGAGPVVARINAATTQAEKLRIVFKMRDTLLTEPNGVYKATQWMNAWGLAMFAVRGSVEDANAAMSKMTSRTKEQEAAAEAYRGEVVKLTAAWDEFATKSGIAVFPWLTATLQKLEKLGEYLERFEKFNRGDTGQGTLLGKVLPGYDTPAPNYSTRGGYRPPAAGGGSSSESWSDFFFKNKSTRGGYKPISFGGMGGDGGDLSDGSRMVKDGVFAALVDFQAYVAAGGQGGGGIQNASFGGSSGAAAGGGFKSGGGYTLGGGSNLTPGTGGAQGGQPQAYEPGTGKVIGSGSGGVSGGSAGGSGGITAPAGTPIAKTGLATVTAASGRKFQVDARFASNFQGFINDYEKAGGVLGPESGTLGHRPHNASGHPIGAAIDINQVGYGVRGRGGRTLPVETENEIAKKWGMVSGANWRRPDTGHFGIKNVEEARQALIRNGVSPEAATAQAEQQTGQKASAGGKTVRGSVFATPDDKSEPPGRKTAGGYSNQIPGIALPKSYGKPKGQMYEVTTPDGRTFNLPHIDTGPHPRTGRGIDITGAAASQMGYTSKNFPTDGGFSYRRVDEQIAGGGPNVSGNVNVRIESNGTAARASASADGLWQKSTIENYRQMQPTSSPASVDAAPPF